MKLSIREAATLLGVPTRTLRARASRGGIPATKSEGRWQLDSSALPLDSRAQRQRLAKASAIRQAVDAALPSRIPGALGRGLRSVADIEAIRLGTELLARLRLLEPCQPEIERWIERAVMRLAESAALFDPRHKLRRINRARVLLARATARLLMLHGIPPPEPIAQLVANLEFELLPQLGGLARWAEKLAERRR